METACLLLTHSAGKSSERYFTMSNKDLFCFQPLNCKYIGDERKIPVKPNLMKQLLIDQLVSAKDGVRTAHFSVTHRVDHTHRTDSSI